VEDAQGTSQRVLWWQADERALPEGRFDLACTVRASDFRGQRDVQATWMDARPIGDTAVAVHAAPKIRVVDHRRAVSPEAALRSLRTLPDTELWCEAEHRAKFAGRDRSELQPAKALIVWTTPPGPVEMRDALRKASPETVYLIASDPGFDKPAAFLKRLAGLVKHSIEADEGRVSISRLAAATAQREATVWAGIAWLLARGHVAMSGGKGDEMRLTPGSGKTGADLARIAAELRVLLEETAAYRAHFARADAGALIARA